MAQMVRAHTVLSTQFLVRVPLMLKHVDQKGSDGHQGQQVLHQKWIWGIHCTQISYHASKGFTLALNSRVDVTRSPKQRYEWPHKKDWCPSIFLKKNSYLHISYTGQSESLLLRNQRNTKGRKYQQKSIHFTQQVYIWFVVFKEPESF